MKECYLYHRLDKAAVQCRACSHFCKIKPGHKGICNVRENQGGTLVSLVYDRVIAASVDPIEKKPIFHLKPGSTSFSIATVGCNFKCRFCQNADIAQMPQVRATNSGEGLPGRAFSPEHIVEQALARGCESISYTYTEPSVFFDLVFDTARLAREKGLYNIFVTNGYMSPELIQMAAPVLDAVNVDLKAFTNDFYERFCKAKLSPVKETLKLMKKAGILVEVTTLVIPGLNDDSKELSDMATFIANDLGPETPWHLSRFHPAYKMQDKPPTPGATLEQACEIGEQAGLFHVYTGNLAGGRENTHCTSCQGLLVQRTGYDIKNYIKEKGTCPGCNARVHGIY